MGTDLEAVNGGALALAGSVPLLTREKFAHEIGLPVGVVVGWANKGLIPLVRVGRYSLVNVELLRKRCVDRDFGHAA